MSKLFDGSMATIFLATAVISGRNAYGTLTEKRDLGLDINGTDSRAMVNLHAESLNTCALPATAAFGTVAYFRLLRQGFKAGKK